MTSGVFTEFGLFVMSLLLFLDKYLLCSFVWRTAEARLVFLIGLVLLFSLETCYKDSLSLNKLCMLKLDIFKTIM